MDPAMNGIHFESMYPLLFGTWHQLQQAFSDLIYLQDILICLCLSKLLQSVLKAILC